MRMIPDFRKAAMVAGILGCIPAGPAPAQTLTLAVGAPVTSIDPHYHNLTPNQALASHIFDPLVDMDATSHPVPALAESWKLVDEHTWEFKLRTAKFHNGADFTAEDVAFTLDRVPKVANSPSSYAIFTKAITGAEIVGPHTIRLTTKGVYPLLPIDLTQVAVISRAAGPNPATEDFNNGTRAVGTGPFRFVSYKPGDRIELDRNDAWWRGAPAWRHVTYRMISNDGARTAALLAGDVQFIESVPTSDIAKLRTNAAVAIAETVSLRLIYLGLDQSRDGPTPYVTGPNGEALDRNPLKDRRVRQALSVAINRPAIVSRVMEGAAISAGQFLPPGSFSYVPELGPPPFDPAVAKRLLGEVGYPNGLRITLHSPNDRYLNDAKIAQAIGQMWTRAGVQTAVETLPWTSFVGHANKQDYSAFLLGWGSATGEASNPLRALVAGWNPAKGYGTTNRGRYDNPALDALIDQALGTVDDGAREKLLQEATQTVFDDVAVIPLHNQKNTWAMRAGLTYVPRADEQTRAVDLRPAK
jgi:peptide/nickel transport system substrate-binding protein